MMTFSILKGWTPLIDLTKRWWKIQRKTNSFLIFQARILTRMDSVKWEIRFGRAQGTMINKRAKSAPLLLGVRRFLLLELIWNRCKISSLTTAIIARSWINQKSEKLRWTRMMVLVQELRRQFWLLLKFLAAKRQPHLDQELIDNQIQTFRNSQRYQNQQKWRLVLVVNYKVQDWTLNRIECRRNILCNRDTPRHSISTHKL